MASNSSAQGTNTRPGVKGFVSIPVEGRFWPKVTKTDGCWEWIGATDGRYGQFWINGKREKAHRVSWFLSNGEWPDRLVCHHCDNPPCVRPDHLFVGTMSDNIRDAVNKRRVVPPGSHFGRTHCKNEHVLSGQNVGVNYRGFNECVPCRKLRAARCKARASIAAEPKP